MSEIDLRFEKIVKQMYCVRVNKDIVEKFRIYCKKKEIKQSDLISYLMQRVLHEK